MKKFYCLLLTIILGILNCPIISAQDYCKGMDVSNMTHKISGDIVTFIWTPVDGDTVKIDHFEPEEGIYKNIGTVKMNEGKFNFKIKWNGEHIFSFSNGLDGCSGLRYKIDVMSKNIENNNIENKDYCKGMDVSNMTHKISGDIVTFIWTPVDGDTVKIDHFEPEEGIYKNIGTVKMNEGKFNFKIKWNGEHIFSFSNGLDGCSGLRYKIDVMSKNIENNNIENKDYCKGMDVSNMTHKISGDIVTFIWTPVDGDTVKIDHFEPEEGIYKNIGTAKMNEGKFNFKIKWNGEHIFSFSNGLDGCNELKYKIDVMSKSNMDSTGIEIMTGYNNITDEISNVDLRKEEGGMINNGYSRELNDAYGFAFKNGITTMQTIEKAKINSPLTRIAMAKMLSNYAINILGKKPANVVVPNFPDVSEKLNEDYGGAVNLAYQLGIMGIGTDKFRPYDSVTRKEFGTALSRMLFGLDDGTDKYYSTHLKELKKRGIISNDNPDLKELRGYVMLMLMRSAM